jgi:hypothetical protein
MAHEEAQTLFAVSVVERPVNEKRRQGVVELRDGLFAHDIVCEPGRNRDDEDQDDASTSRDRRRARSYLHHTVS